MSSEALRIGELLVKSGRLSAEQAEEVHRAQRHRWLPFGVLAEEMHGVRVPGVEEAWVEQYHRETGTLELRGVEPTEGALRLLHRRQAHQFRMVPVRFEPGGELLVVACRSRLARAVTFAAHRIPGPAHFRVAARGPLDELLARHYPAPARCAL